MKFKVGQKVKYKSNNNPNLPKGYETTVLGTGYGIGKDTIRFKDLNGIVQFSYSEYWELISDVNEELFQ